MDMSSRVAARYLKAGTYQKITGNQRDAYQADVWEMYAGTYKAIGLHLKGPDSLKRYAVWEVSIGKEGKPQAFLVYKKTAYGLKAGLGGHDGSSAGKKATVDAMRSLYKKAGYYTEVSHKVEIIVLAAGAPVVCAAHVGKILGGPVAPSKDGLHYTRALGSLGNVEKIMVGRPKGVPTTDHRKPTCPIGGKVAVAIGVEEEPDEMCLAEHAGCMLF
jgi:hypothetical protein